MARAREFAGFYEREARSVLVFFARRTLDGEVALDLTAETFAQAWTAWPRVRAGSREEVRGWLFTIARRQLGRYLRHGRVERRAMRRLQINVPLVHEDDLAEIEAEAGLTALRTALAVQLAALRADQREALQLRVVDELPYPLVAQRLGISEDAARARVSRGLRALARALDPIVAAEEARG